MSAKVLESRQKSLYSYLREHKRVFFERKKWLIALLYSAELYHEHMHGIYAGTAHLMELIEIEEPRFIIDELELLSS